MQRIVLTGGPGAGKTTVLDLLRKQGFITGDDAARSIIRERKRAGLPPRPDALTFAQQIFARETDAYRSAESSPSFFERGMVEAIAALLGSGGLSEEEAERLLHDFHYQAVFIFPPWEEIYSTDDERDHTFDHSLRVYESISGFYRRYEYKPIIVPIGPVSDRADFIIDHIRYL